MSFNILNQGKHASYWRQTALKPSFNSFSQHISADVAVVGGGITGIITAFLLKQEGKKVALLEAETLGSGVTGFTTAKVTSLHTLIYSHLIKKLGKEKARLYGVAQEEAIVWLMDCVEEYSINCGCNLVPAYTYTTVSEKLEEIYQEVSAAQELGLPAFFTDEVDIPFPIKGAIGFENQAYFHPLKFLYALAERIPGKGSYIFEQTRVVDVEENEPCVVKTEKGDLKADHVVIATNYPILDRGGFFARLSPHRSYGLRVQIKDPIPQGMFINIDDPLFSFRPDKSSKEPGLIITALEHKTGYEKDTVQCYQKAEELVKKHFVVKSIDYYWSTQDPFSIDKVPFIGRYTPKSERLWLATGFGGWGMTNGIVSGLLLKDLILGQFNPWSEVFNPHRFEQVKEVGEVIKTGTQVAKMFVEDRYIKKYTEGLENLESDQAEIRQLNGQPVAVYKDEEGKISKVSAYCSHQGCIINFNTAEKSWDCPCHGSRFSVEGKVLHGPAVKNLEKV